VDDVLACYQALRRRGYAAEQIVLAGDSAGGGLALATTLRLRASGDELPAVLGLISPWLDLELTGDSVARKAGTDPLLQASWLHSCAEAYRGELPAGSPEISPLHADLTGLPPIVLHTGTEEIIASDSERLAGRAKEAGLEVSYRDYESLWHDFHLFGGFLGDADTAIADLVRELDARIGKG
jgi:monoterpene epsilon-lactone hydrolase